MEIDVYFKMWSFLVGLFVLTSLIRYSAWSGRRWSYIIIIVTNIVLAIYGVYFYCSYDSSDVFRWSFAVLLISIVTLFL
jgi:hypothetical protein